MSMSEHVILRIDPSGNTRPFPYFSPISMNTGDHRNRDTEGNKPRDAKNSHVAVGPNPVCDENLEILVSFGKSLKAFCYAPG